MIHSKSPFLPGKLKRLLLCATSAAMLVFASGATAAEPEKIALKEQPLAVALNKVASQRDLNIIFSSEKLKGKISNHVAGLYSTEEALSRMLAGSGLGYEIDDKGNIYVGEQTGRSVAAGFQKISLHGNEYYEGNLELEDDDGTYDVGNATLDEVIVTAQKRAQSIMDVPISMTAFTSGDIEKLRIQKVEDFLLRTPGVQYNETSEFLKTVSIRGLNDSLGGLFQTAGVTLDDATLIATYNGFLLTSRLFDIERVEILRGPQGTLTGSNSTSGSINIITKKPNLEETEGEVTLDYGRYNSMVIRGILNVPLSDTLAVRTTAYLESSDGAVKNIGPAGGGSTEDHYGARVAVRWKPSDELTLDVAFTYEHQKFGASNALGLDVPGYDDPANDGLWWADNLRRNLGALEAAGGDYSQSDFLEDVGMSGGNVYRDVREKTEHKLWYTTFRANYEMEEHTIDLIYTHYEHDVETLYDEDRSEFAFVTSGWKGGPKSNFAELRISSDYEGSFNWVAGGSYMKERRVLNLWYDITDAFLEGYFDVFGGGIAALDDPYTYYKDYWNSTLEQIESKALFANVFWDITDRLHLSAGARMSFVNTATQEQNDLDGIFGPFDNPDKAKGTSFDPRIALNFDLSDNVTTYVQFATSYRAGYANVGLAVDLGIADKDVQPERLINYEIGLKGRFFDNRMTVAAAVFYMDYSNMQAGTSVPVSLPDFPSIDRVYFDANLQKAKSRGFELEGDFMITEGLIFSGGMSYVKATIDAVDDEFSDGFGAFTNVAFPSVPAWTVDASLEYTHNISDDMWATFMTEINHRSTSRTDFLWWVGDKVEILPSHKVINMSVGLHTDKWSATAYMNNVFGEIYWQDTGVGYSTRGVNVPFNPQTFGIRLTRRL